MTAPMQRMLDAVRKRDALLRGEQVTYLPVGGSPSYTLRVVPTAPQSELESPAGAVITTRQSDFIVEVADLQRLPEQGDVIVYRDAHFKVTHPGGGGVYDYHDSYRQSLRIHTMEIPRRVDVIAGYGNRDGIGYANPSGVSYAKPRG